MMGRAILEADGYRVQIASSGSLAFRLLARSPKPDLILLDMEMNTMPGSEFLRLLRLQDPDYLDSTPVVFYSANRRSDVCAATGFIQKSGNIEKFRKCVRSFLGPPGRVA